MEMNGLLRRKMVVWNYSRLHTPEVGATTECNGSVATLLYLPLWSYPIPSSRVGRGGSHAPERYIFLTKLFVILKVSIKGILMFPMQIIVPCMIFSPSFVSVLDFRL